MGVISGEEFMKNRRRLIGIFSLMIFSVALISSAEAGEKSGPAKEITATYVKSEIGDYNHAIFLNKSGEELSFWCSAKMIDFLERHKGKEMAVTYSIKEVFIPEANKKMPIEILEKVRVGGFEFKDPGS
jgi:hypothetical protein